MLKSIRTLAAPHATPAPWKIFGQVLTTPKGNLQILIGKNEDGGEFSPHLYKTRHADTVMSDLPCRFSSDGGLGIVPCGPDEDEKILLVAAANSAAAEIEAVGAAILCYGEEAATYLAVQVAEADGHLAIRQDGVVDVYSWKGGYMRLPEERYDAARADGSLFLVNDWEESDLAVCAEKRAAWEASRLEIFLQMDADAADTAEETDEAADEAVTDALPEVPEN